MPVSAHDVAAVLRDRLIDLPTKKLHKLLYYCQGHHLAAFNEPLFTETISAWDMGPVVGTLWHDDKRGQPPPAPSPLDEAQLNTVGYVLSRYGSLTGFDLENLTHSEMPWQRANERRRPAASARIEPEWIKEYFSTRGAPDDAADGHLDTTAVSRWLAGAADRRAEPVRPDDRAELLARLGRDG